MEGQADMHPGEDDFEHGLQDMQSADAGMGMPMPGALLLLLLPFSLCHLPLCCSAGPACQAAAAWRTHSPSLLPQPAVASCLRNGVKGRCAIEGSHTSSRFLGLHCRFSRTCRRGLQHDGHGGALGHARGARAHGVR